MSGFLTIWLHTLSEARHRKLLVASFALIGLQLILIAALVGSASGMITVAGALVHGMPGGTDALGAIFAGLAVTFYYPGLLLMVWLTAGFFPRMQERGSIDLLLSKPIGRLALFAGRFAGCATIALAASTLYFGGNYLVLGWKTGIWIPAFLLTIPATLFAYTAFLTMMALISQAGRSTALSAALVTGYAVFIGPLLYAAETELGRTLMGDSAWAGLFAVLYNVLPRTTETGSLLFEAVRHGRIGDTTALLQVALSSLAWFAVGAFWFHRKDY
ncbi:MAG: ABC transporter permease subunit [Deltaproteobacteria bacterium]|nr:ABC transporter permease subunit [Deltaproteobacteria bacterium]